MISADKLASCFPAPAPQPQSAGNSVGGRGIAASPESLRTYLETHGVRVADTKRSAGDTVFVLDCCPANPEHGSDRAAAVIWSAERIGFKCHHDRCSGITWKQVRAKIDPTYEKGELSGDSLTDVALPEVTLPGGATTITQSAQTLGRLIGKTNTTFLRGNKVFNLQFDADDQPSLTILEPARLASDFEKVAALKKFDKDGKLAPCTCNEQAAKLILISSTFQNELPRLVLVTNCPVLVEHDAKLIQIVGYDDRTGIFAGGKRANETSTTDAVRLIEDMLDEFLFVSESDRSRAIAAVITPALVMSGLLAGRPALDLGEADESQAGKGFRNKLTAAVYNSQATTVSQRRSGVGGMEESFDSALIQGKNFIAFDNVRGSFDSPRTESFLTEDTYLARAPYTGNIEIDTKRVVVMLTSNKAEITPDLANRSCIVRIRKQPPSYVFRSFREGDLLAHIRANQSRYLGAVFSVVRAWHEAGRPRQEVGGHDFRPWAGTLSWIIENVFHAPPLLEGHRDAQARVASPNLTWLRDIAIAVDRAGRLGQPLRPAAILEIAEGLEAQQSELPEGDESPSAAAMAIGRKMNSCLNKGEHVSIDRYLITRVDVPDEGGRIKRAYIFRDSPNGPQSPPMRPQ